MQAAIGVEILESVRQKQAVAAAAAPSSATKPDGPDPLDAFVAAHHGGDKRKVLEDPALHEQLVALLGVESSVLLSEMQGIGMDVKEMKAKLDDIREGMKRMEEQLAEAAYAFLREGLTPELQAFWRQSFSTSQQVSRRDYSQVVHRCGRTRGQVSAWSRLIGRSNVF